MDKNITDLYLENQLCFPLYAASRLTTKAYAPYLNNLNITYPQYLVMLVLWQYKEQSVNEIGERLMLESNTLTPLLKRLESKEFLLRNRSKTDERSVIVSLTEKGNALKEEASSIPTKIMGSFKDTSISEAEIISFKETLHKLVAVLDQKNSGGKI
ncbi:MarR family transcriptional regulator [Salegentibacter sp. F188]|uniref:HTH-type transcriptional regulator SarZ n=1 Tax=Autumnicola patrickiae TaxID=3075591 RepID=A0ABU3E4E3_9FLAO|nr:MarR family transcriptional regulator [Salegentibacter sp. F188]MDT0690861.1 MarR family transcriptional regulator [Salegentibacter sp. F188]